MAGRVARIPNHGPSNTKRHLFGDYVLVIMNVFPFRHPEMIEGMSSLAKPT